MVGVAQADKTSHSSAHPMHLKQSCCQWHMSLQLLRTFQSGLQTHDSWLKCSFV